MRYVFGDYVLDTQRHEFWCRKARIKLRPKVFQVLIYLVEHRDRVISKDELLEHLWPGQFISDGSLNACLMAVRKAVGDSGRNQRYIQTLHSRGYRFIADVCMQTDTSVTAVSPPSDAPTRWCLTCEHQNPASAAFCNACGVSLALRCPSCHADNPPEFRFCNACGVATQPAEVQSPERVPQDVDIARLVPGAERRQLTVMACDVVGATALSEQLDPEPFREAVRAYHQLCTEVMQAFDGHIAQYLGDGILAYFGHPLAHDDDVQRAIRAGLRMLEGIHTFNRQL